MKKKKNAFVIYLSPSEHDDRLHLRRFDTTVWGFQDEGADYFHNHVFPSLESNSARTYVIDTVYALQYALNKYPGDIIRVKKLLDNGQLAVSGNYIAFSGSVHEQESVVRIVIYAKWYLRNQLEYEARFIKKPDSYGFSPQMGQIYNKAGIELYVNNRLAYLTQSYFWNWVGLDGTKTLTLHPHYFYGTHSSSARRKNKKGLDSYSEYTEEVSQLGHNLFDGLSEKNWPSKIAWVQVGTDISKPNILNIQSFIEGWNQEPDQVKPIKWSNLTNFLDEVKKDISSGTIKLEKWTRWGTDRGIREDDDSLPLIRHLNDARRRLLDLEKLSSLCDIVGLAKYPISEIQEDWGKLLFGRDHSGQSYIGSINGTSFSDVGREAEFRIGDLLKDRLNRISDAVDYSDYGTPVFVFNSLNWTRTEPVELELTLSKDSYRAVDASGSEVPLQIISSEDVGEGKTLYRFVLMAEDVPSFGYKVFYIKPSSASEKTDFTFEDGVLENTYYRISVNMEGFQSIFDKELKREIIENSKVSTFRKTGKGETVNFGEVISSRFFEGTVQSFSPFPYLKKGSLISRMRVDNVTLVESGPVRATMRINGHLDSEGIVITVSLFTGLKRVGLKFELVRSGEMLDSDKNGEPDYVTIPLPFKMNDDMKQQVSVLYGSLDNPVLADIAEGTEGGSSIGIQWPDQPAALGRIVDGGFSKHQRSENVKGHIGYRWNRHTDKKHVNEWTDVREADDSWGVTIAHPGVIQYERLNFVAPALCAWQPGLRAWGKNYGKGAFQIIKERPPLFIKAIPEENYAVDLLVRSHKGNWDTSEAYKLGSEKNYPFLVCHPNKTSGGTLKEEASFINLEPTNVLLTAMKKTEDGSGYVTRIYEASDTDSEVNLKLNIPKKLDAATRTNLMEDNLENLSIVNNTLSTKIKGFGIETIKLVVS